MANKMEHREADSSQIIRKLQDHQGRINELEKQEQEREALFEAKAVFEGLFEFAPDALVVVDRNRHIRRLNTAAENLFGYTREELIGQDHGVLVPDHRKAKHEVEMKAYMSAPRIRVMGIGLELYGRRKDGSDFPADIDLGPLQTAGELLVIAVVRDVTPRKKLEVDLVESEKRYRELVELLPDTVVISRQDRVVFVNPAGARLFGVASVEPLIGKPVMELVHPEYRQSVASRIRLVTEEGKTVPLIDEKLLRVDGPAVDVDTISIPYTHQGKPAVLSIIRDVSERKKLEDELARYRARLEEAVVARTSELAQANTRLAQEIDEHRKSEEGLLLRAAILDHAGDAIFLINPHGDFVYVNEAACQTYGYSREEFLKMNLRQLLPAKDAPLIESRLKKALETRQLVAEAVHLRKDQTPMPVRVSHTLIKTLHGEFIVSISHVIENEVNARRLNRTD